MAKGTASKNGASPAVLNAKDRSNGSHPLNRLFSRIANTTSREVGRAWVFALAVGTIIVWAVSGPFFDFSDTWQLVINTGTTIVTFLMVFLIQNAQNRDAAAIQVKLNELIRVSKAHNSFVGVEHLTEEEIEEIRSKCESRVKTERTRRAPARPAAAGSPEEQIRR
jgi:low affinity Fe/Cu permease